MKKIDIHKNYVHMMGNIVSEWKDRVMYVGYVIAET